MFRKILLAVDVSGADTEVLRRANVIARQNLGSLTALHVVETADAEVRKAFARQGPIDDVILSAARSQLETMVTQQVGPGAPHDLRIETGSPHDCILSLAQEMQADLIVVGANQRQSLRDKLLGGTADRVVRRAKVPVLVVKHPCKGPYRRVAAAIDFESGSDHVAKLAGEISSSDHAQLVHVVDLPLPFEQALLSSGWGAAELSRERVRLKRDALARLEDMARRVFDSSLARSEVIIGEIASSLLKMSRRRGLDLMVLGRGDRGVIERVLLGSVALRLLHQAASDILIVPPQPG